jgi:hypothetical protein
MRSRIDEIGPALSLCACSPSCDRWMERGWRRRDYGHPGRGPRRRYAERVSFPCFRSVGGVLLGVWLLGAASACTKEQEAPLDATALVRRAVALRVDEQQNHRPLRYLLHKRDDRRDTTKEIVETKDGDVARLVAVGGKPLSAEADRAELARLDNLAAHPELQEQRYKQELEDAKRVTDLLNLMPDAMVYKMEATEPCISGQCYRMSFAPKPGWNGPALESDLLRGVAGEVWVDTRQNQLVRLDANFISDVNFGLGLLARLYQGSTARLEQADVRSQIGNGGTDWELTGLTLDIKGKALLFKAIDVQTTEQTSHYAEVPPGFGYRDAIRMLKSEGLN